MIRLGRILGVPAHLSDNGFYIPPSIRGLSPYGLIPILGLTQNF